MGSARPWVFLLLLAGASAEECAAKAASAEGGDAPAEDCGCSSLKRDAVLEQTREGEESSPDAKVPPAVEGAPTTGQDGAAARGGGDAKAGTPAELLWIPGGEFVMGHNDESVSPSTFTVDGEGPARRVAVSGVWMGQTEVSNAQWAAFAEATGYKSESEKFGW